MTAAGTSLAAGIITGPFTLGILRVRPRRCENTRSTERVGAWYTRMGKQTAGQGDDDMHGKRRSVLPGLRATGVRGQHVSLSE